MITRFPRIKPFSSSFSREIAWLLAIKAVVLYVIWYAFFSEPQLEKMTEGLDPDHVAATLITPNTPEVSTPPLNPMEYRHGH